MRGWFRNGALIGASVVAALVALETCVRMRFGARAHAVLESRLGNGTLVEIDTPRGELGPGIAWSEFPDLVYELRPNLRGTYDGNRFSSNRLGFRHDHETRLEKPENVFRVLGVGDEAMLGRGVDNGETYLDHLQAKLGAYSPGRVEVINAAVWGYNTTQVVATVRWKAARLEPDLVVLGLSGNDRDRPVVRGGIPFPSSGSYLWHATRRLLTGNNEDIVREESSARSDFDGFVETLDELAHLAREHGFRVVVFSECLVSEEPPSHCNLATAEQRGDWHHRNFTHWGFALCPWRWDLVPTEGTTPTADGNRILADILYDCIMANRQTRPPLLMTNTVEIPVGRPSLRLQGFQLVEPASACAAWSETGAQIEVRWLPVGEHFRVSLRLVDVAHLARVRFGPPDAVREVGIDADLIATYPEPLEVDQTGSLHLELALGAQHLAGPPGPRVPNVALTSLLLTQP